MSQSSDRPSPIAFALTREPRGLPNHYLLLIIPVEDRWNDFGLRVHVSIGIRDKNSEFEWVDGFLAFKDENDTKDYLKRTLSKHGKDWIEANALTVPFASMLRNVRGYQQLLRLLGTDGAQFVATSSHDAAFANISNKEIDGWPKFFTTPAFNRAFMRYTETVFAYRNVGPIFAGQSLEAEDARQDFPAIVKLGKASLSYVFKFPQGLLTESRLSVIIGRNGKGKTASLIALSRSLADRENKSATLTARPTFNQLLVYAHSRSLRRFKIASRNPRSGSQKTFALDPTRSAASQTGLTSQLAMIARDSDSLDNPLGSLIEVIDAEFEGLSVMVPVDSGQPKAGRSPQARDYLPLNTFHRGTEQLRLDRIASIDATRPLLFVGPDAEPRQLSLGQDVFIAFAFHAIGNSGPASIFLIDEPENFLHPTLISRFVRLLDRVLQKTKSIAIVATHSPFVVREVQRTQVHILQSSQSEQISVEHPRLQTFGANVSSICDHIFGDDLVDHLHVRLLRHAESNDMTLEQLYEQMKDELSLDALMLLRQERERKEDGS